MKSWVVSLEEDENGELILPLNDEILNEVGWKTGDNLDWKDLGDGTWSISKVEKVEKELVFVEAISTFRMRYVVEVPKGKKEWALDTVTCNDAEELSQEHIGELIVSHRVINKDEYLRIFHEDNEYLNSWDEKLKFSRFITKIDKDGKIEKTED
jgi:hypothetical protein